jgi:hypothetical protein
MHYQHQLGIPANFVDIYQKSNYGLDSVALGEWGEVCFAALSQTKRISSAGKSGTGIGAFSTGGQTWQSYSKRLCMINDLAKHPQPSFPYETGKNL